ncbi:MAG: hypothetical protein LBR22_01430 [Desulfovibrio sp.]|nr:hypothetical protein [Desulfovibrio sp.]
MIKRQGIFPMGAGTVASGASSSSASPDAVTVNPSYVAKARYDVSFCAGFRDVLGDDGLTALVDGATRMGVKLAAVGGLDENGDADGSTAELNGTLTFAEIPGLMSAISAILARLKREGAVAVTFEEQDYHPTPNGGETSGLVLAYATAQLTDIMDGRKLGHYAATVFRPADARIPEALLEKAKGICAHHMVRLESATEGILAVACGWGMAKTVAQALGRAFVEFGENSCVAVTGLARDGSCPENAVYVVLPDGTVVEHEILYLWLDRVPGRFPEAAADFGMPF